VIGRFFVGSVPMFEVALQCQVPTVLYGPNGIGKTSRVGALARLLNRELIRIPLLGLEPPDLTGLPLLKGDHVEFVPPKMISQLKENPDRYILLLDEINRIPPDKVQALICQLLDREHGVFNIPNSVLVVGTCNITDLGIFKPSKMLRSRMAWFECKPDSNLYLKFLQDGEFDNQFHIVPSDWPKHIQWARNLMYIFLSTHRSLILKDPEEDSDAAEMEFPYRTQRGFDMTINIWAGLRALGISNVQNLEKALASTCGISTAATFRDFLSKIELPDTEKFINEYLLEGIEYDTKKYNLDAFLYLMMSEVYYYMLEKAASDISYARRIWKASMDYLESYIKKEKAKEVSIMLVRLFVKADSQSNLRIAGQIPPSILQLIKKVV